MMLYIDFDDVIHNPHAVMRGHKMGVPHLGAQQTMRKWADQGHTLVIFTTRATNPKSIKAVTDWLNYFEIPFAKVTNLKGDADVYIDNKGYKFMNWPQLSRYIEVAFTVENPTAKPSESLDAVEW